MIFDSTQSIHGVTFAQLVISNVRTTSDGLTKTTLTFLTLWTYPDGPSGVRKEKFHIDAVVFMSVIRDGECINAHMSEKDVKRRHDKEYKLICP